MLVPIHYFIAHLAVRKDVVLVLSLYLFENINDVPVQLLGTSVA